MPYNNRLRVVLMNLIDTIRIQYFYDDKYHFLISIFYIMIVRLQQWSLQQ